MNVGDVICEKQTSLSLLRKGKHGPAIWTPCDCPSGADVAFAATYGDGWLYCSYRGSLYRYRTVDVNYLMQKIAEGVEL